MVRCFFFCGVCAMGAALFFACVLLSVGSFFFLVGTVKENVAFCFVLVLVS